MFLKTKTERSMNDCLKKTERLKEEIENSDAVVIGAGAGLSAAAGFAYSGTRFEKYFSDFKEKYGFDDMYTGGFYPYKSLSEYWAFWSRYIYINRYMDPMGDVYKNLQGLVKDKDYFVITTNVDHCFQKAGFDKSRLFYTQGDYGLFQCSKPCSNETYDNEEAVKEMLIFQGFKTGEDNELLIPEEKTLKTEISEDLIPVCGRCGKPLTMNLRSDDTFAQDEGWHRAAERYLLFLRRHEGMKILFLELGVGYNTPVIIKFPFWQMASENKNAVYACINKGQASCPKQIEDRAVCIDADIAKVLKELKGGR